MLFVLGQIHLMLKAQQKLATLITRLWVNLDMPSFVIT